MYYLGMYDDEADAARAFDRVASALGRPLNFPEEDELEIVGQSSEGADQAVTEAVKAAETFMDTDKAKQAKRAAERVKKVSEVNHESHKHFTDSRHANPQLSRFLNRRDRPSTRESVQKERSGSRESG